MTRARRNTDDIPGLTAFLTTPFIVVSMIVLMSWLVLNGLITVLWAWVLGSIVSAAAGFVLPRLYRILLGSSISRPGCLAGLYAYGAALVVWALLAWQGGWAGALLGIVLVPVCCFSCAAFISVRTVEDRQRRRSQKRTKSQHRR